MVEDLPILPKKHLNRIAEFHTELELLPVKVLEHPCIKHAVELEQSFMEGAYNRVLSARQACHMRPTFTSWTFSRKQLHAIVFFCSHRDEIAGCSEKGYDSLSKAKESQPCKEIPSLQLINQALSYARELERIV
ncbi:unnamed protein product [Miscanthus lutarioriparius]|uniref:CSN8/PSMD8/EIF3K domain-containing protein n=1 Tax=Miscanthus lutarioriparius TaxID=422564 RepID=A0A811R7B0_9POAL|nr:unnamed protein product [Miscanthus lutarioriparius]